MSSVLFLKELWRRRRLVGLAVLVAGFAALLVVYKVSLFPPSLSERQKVDAEGSIQVLVDSSNSPIANARRDLSGLTARAGVFARVMSGGNVIQQAAAEADIPFRQIQVAGPMPLPGEAPGISEGPARELPYRVEITQQTELPILTVATKAPTVAQAGALAAAVPRAMSARVHAIQRNQGTPDGRRVEFRALGPAQAGLIDDSGSKKIAVGVFVFLLALFVTLIVGLPRFLAAWRAADAEAKPAAPAKPPKPRRKAKRPGSKVKKPKVPRKSKVRDGKPQEVEAKRSEAEADEAKRPEAGAGERKRRETEAGEKPKEPARG